MKYMDWPLVESRQAWREWLTQQEQRALTQQEQRAMDTDALLQPIQTAKDQLDALEDIVEANTAAFKELRKDLGQCNNQEKVQAIINKVEKAMTDLAIDSQKIPKWVRQRSQDGTVTPNDATIPGVYGQYPINQPINPWNPVPWPPGYTPPS